MIEYYIYGIVVMAMAESIQRGYDDKDIDGQMILNSILWPFVILSLIGRIIYAITNSRED